jgi:hypothetical protein
MSKLFSKVVIEDVRNAGCTDREVELLLDIYSRTVKRMATTLARKAYYELIDFKNSDEVNGFSLEVERDTYFDRYIGVFKDGLRTLEVVSGLEQD